MTSFGVTNSDGVKLEALLQLGRIAAEPTAPPGACIRHHVPCFQPSQEETSVADLKLQQPQQQQLPQSIHPVNLGQATHSPSLPPSSVPLFAQGSPARLACHPHRPTTSSDELEASLETDGFTIASPLPSASPAFRARTSDPLSRSPAHGEGSGVERDFPSRLLKSDRVKNVNASTSSSARRNNYAQLLDVYMAQSPRGSPSGRGAPGVSPSSRSADLSARRSPKIQTWR